jgi:hypothetical protein
MNSVNNNDEKLDLADKLNRYRVFPRLFALFYMFWAGKVIWWAMGLPDPSIAEWLVAAVTVPAAAFFHTYCSTGTKK